MASKPSWKSWAPSPPGAYSCGSTTPYRSETLTGKDGKSYEVLYYYTHLKQRDDRITDDELTPLVFQGGKLIGRGYPFPDQRVPPKPVYTR